MKRCIMKTRIVKRLFCSAHVKRNHICLLVSCKLSMCTYIDISVYNCTSFFHSYVLCGTLRLYVRETNRKPLVR